MSSVTWVSGWSLPRGRRRPGRVKSVGFLGQGGFEFQFGAAFGEGGVQFGLGLVDELAGGGAFLLGQRAQLLHQGGEFSVRAKPRALGLVKGGQIGGGLKLGQRGLLERFDVHGVLDGQGSEGCDDGSYEFDGAGVVYCGAAALALRADWANCTRAAKASASRAASSAIILRFSAHWAALRPSMKRL